MKTNIRPRRLQQFVCVFFLTVWSIASCKKENDVPKTVDTNPVVLPCDYFSTDRILVDDTSKPIDYVVNCVMDISAQVQIQPGVVIQFRENAGWSLQSGYLKSLGTSAKPVVLTGSPALPGIWKGIYFQNNSIQNQLSYTRIEYAGGSAFDSNGDRGSILAFGATTVDIDHCTIYRSGHHGLNLPYDDATLIMNHTSFQECSRAPVNIQPQYLGSMNPTNSFSGNAESFIGVQLNGGAITANTTVQPSRIPYRVYRVSGFYDFLNIENGMFSCLDSVRIQFEAGTGVYVAPSGGISLLGSPVSRPKLSAVNPMPGVWKGIYIEASQANNRFEHAIIEYSGSLHQSERFGIYMLNNPKLRVENTSFRSITGCALFDYSGAGSPNPNLTLLNNTLDNVSGGEVCYP
jgi:hypothetical protein